MFKRFTQGSQHATFMLEGGLGIVARKGHLRAKVRDVVA